MAVHRRPIDAVWDAQVVRALRCRLALSQQALAGELGVRQQTVSEWETGLYTPRGASRRVLAMVAESAGVYVVDLREGEGSGGLRKRSRG